MSVNIQFLCDRVDCEQSLDVFTTADPVGITWAVAEASDAGWVVVPRRRTARLAGVLP